MIWSLRDRKECYAYLQVALDAYQEDNDADALLIALRNVAEARGGITALNNKAGEGDKKAKVGDHIRTLVMNVYKKMMDANPAMNCKN